MAHCQFKAICSVEMSMLNSYQIRLGSQYVVTGKFSSSELFLELKTINLKSSTGNMTKCRNDTNFTVIMITKLRRDTCHLGMTIRPEPVPTLTWKAALTGDRGGDENTNTRPAPDLEPAPLFM